MLNMFTIVGRVSSIIGDRIMVEINTDIKGKDSMIVPVDISKLTFDKNLIDIQQIVGVKGMIGRSELDTMILVADKVTFLSIKKEEEE